MAHRYHVFALPSELINTLTPRNLVGQSPPRDPSPPPPPPQSATQATTTRVCNICPGATFVGVDEQRLHFRTDWHRYNVKIRLSGVDPVTEAAFSQLVDRLEDSLSGSASSDDETSDESDAVNALLSKIKHSTLSDSPEDSTPRSPLTAVTWFHSPPSTQIGVYRMLFPLHTPPSAYLDELKEMQTFVEGGRKWAMFMVAGGHFAGALVRVSRPVEEQDEVVASKARRKPPKPKPEIEVLKHKTFHRYTTRRKQGGSQSVNDNAKGAAISAGAMLRRYGEQALRDDIRNLLRDWAEDVHECERIFIRASVSNRRIFFDYEGCVISKGDDRLRTFPFPTRRPTQAELSRCLQELVQVKVSHLSEDVLRAQDEAYIATLPKSKPQSLQPNSEVSEKPKPVRLTKEEELIREKWNRLLDMVSKGRLEPLKKFWEREGESVGDINVPIPEWTGDRRASLLQVAAQSGHEDVVQWLLYDLRADPTIPVSLAWSKDGGDESDASDVGVPPAGSRRTAYDLARSRAVRDVFRRCAGENADWWDWFGIAHVPSALSKEKEEERDDKRKQRRKGLRDKLRARETRDREKSLEIVAPVEEPPKQKKEPISGPQKLGGSSGSADGISGLTPEMREKVERERRARAAEARLKMLQTSGR